MEKYKYIIKKKLYTTLTVKLVNNQSFSFHKTNSKKKIMPLCILLFSNIDLGGFSTKIYNTEMKRILIVCNNSFPMDVHVIEHLLQDALDLDCVVRVLLHVLGQYPALL